MFAGRPFLFAAAYAGEAGVGHAISLLTKEFDKDKALLGLRQLDEISEEIIIAAWHQAA